MLGGSVFRPRAAPLPHAIVVHRNASQPADDGGDAGALLAVTRMEPGAPGPKPGIEIIGRNPAPPPGLPHQTTFLLPGTPELVAIQ